MRTARSTSTLPPSHYHFSVGQRCGSLYHRVWYRIFERLRWSKKPYYEDPIGRLPELAPWQTDCIARLQARYEVAFESHYGQDTTLVNYAYLDLLDQAWAATGRLLGHGGHVTDVGCANCWYARTLHGFFRSAKLTGVELEGFRLYPTGQSRYDAASGYIAAFPGSTFVVGDYGERDEQADVITAWFPFVTPAPVLSCPGGCR